MNIRSTFSAFLPSLSIALLLQIVSDHQSFVMLIACWVREFAFASVAWKPARKSACSVSCFVVAIRRVWPRIFVLSEKKVPKLCVSVLAWRQRSARRMESWHVHTACGRVQILNGLTLVALRGRPWHKRHNKTSPITSLLNAKCINRINLQPSSLAA